MRRIIRSTFIIGIAIGVLPSKASAQGWIREFGGASADWGKWVEVTSDSGFIICGNMIPKTDEPIDFGDLGYLVKTDEFGNAEWTRTYNSHDLPFEECSPGGYFNCVQQTYDKGYIAVGYGQLEEFAYVFKTIWLVKIDSNGVVEWTKGYGGDDIDKGWFVRQTPDSGYVVAAATESLGDANTSLWILRTDAYGDTLWSLLYGDDERFKYWAYCVNLTSDGSYIVTGGDGSKNALILMKVDDEGKIVWERSYTDPYGGQSWGQYVEETPDGGFIVTGGSMNGEAVFLLKTDADGDSIWTRSYRGSGGQCSGRCVHLTPDDGYIVAARKDYASTMAMAWLLKTDAQGDTVWTRIFGDDRWYNDFESVQLDPRGGYILTGSTGDGRYYNEYELLDVWLVKTDSLGYVPIVENQIEEESNIDTSSPLGKPVQIRYANMPGGFHAYVYDSIGRKVDEIHNANASGTVSWGEGQNPGVYFIKSLTGNAPATKVILTR